MSSSASSKQLFSTLISGNPGNPLPSLPAKEIFISLVFSSNSWIDSNNLQKSPIVSCFLQSVGQIPSRRLSLLSRQFSQSRGMLITYLLGMSEFLLPEVTYAPNRPLKNHICRLGIVFSQRLSSLPTEDSGVSLGGSFQLSKQIQVGLNVRCWQQAFISKQRCKTEKGVCTVIHFSFYYSNRSVNSLANLDRKLPFWFP